MATQRSVTPSAAYGSIPAPQDPAHLNRGYGDASNAHMGANDFSNTPSHPAETSPLSQSLQKQQGERFGKFEEDFDSKTRGSSIIMDGELPERSASRASMKSQGATPSRSNTLKKRGSVKRTGSLKRSGSRRSLRAGSIKGVSLEDDDQGSHAKQSSIFYTPVPTSGSPTEVLANRFQAWRKLLKDLISYFREVATSYESRSKALLKVSNLVNNTNAPAMFLLDGGLNDANRILRDYHKHAVGEATKAKEIENEVINQLSGLRADLAQKIKEIKSLSGDFKNSVEKEKDNTRKAVAALEEALSLVDADPSAVSGKGDPFVVRLGVDRQVERQIDEENYLHRAYLNLENSGRELESIVVGEIQKAYNALASILKREADESYSTVEKLRTGPVAMPRDLEWNQFVTNDTHFVNPDLPLRRLDDIEYPGRHHPAAAEVRAGMLERKSKYLKSYTPGWYVLSPTHLHEFKSADRIYTQPPVMSLLLSDQKLGSHSQPGSSSHKFVLKGRQTGSMHRGHTAETYDTMMAWCDDIRNLIEKTGDERNAFVRRHTHRRSTSAGSARSVSSDGGLEEDEADAVPFSAAQSVMTQPQQATAPRTRPSPGGRFPSDLQVNRHLQGPVSSRSSSDFGNNDLTTASGGLQGTYPPQPVEGTTRGQVHQPVAAISDSRQMDQEQHLHSAYQQLAPAPLQQTTSYYANNPPATPANLTQESQQQSAQGNTPQATQAYAQGPAPSFAPPPTQAYTEPPTSALGQQAPSGLTQQAPQQLAQQPEPSFQRHDSTYGSWMAPTAGGLAAGALGTESYHQHRLHKQVEPNSALGDPLPVSPSLPQSVPERHPDHTAVPLVSAVPASVLADRSVPAPSEPDSLATTPSTLHQSFLGGAEAGPVAASEKVANGGTSATGVANVAQGPGSAPAYRRHNTDTSVSDLHVPGEYPKLHRH